jgi:hypothetical protein
MSDDKVIVFVDGDGGWANLEAITEKQCQIELTIEETPVFRTDIKQTNNVITEDMI